MQISASTIIDDRYEILSLLGEGGMGTVYKARELSLERFVAIKFLHPDLLRDKDSQVRFKREAEICSSLDHRNVNRFYRFGMWDSQCPYITMELIQGTTLRKVLNDTQRLPWSEAVSIVASIADAMEYVHNKGVVHRDLKPSNIMLQIDPSPHDIKVMDFGLGRLSTQQQQHHTQTGQLVGTVYYMSPEQCTGGKADNRSDIYSLGCILFECLVGEPPFTADNPIGVLHLHATKALPNLNSFSNLADLPEALNAVLARSTAKSPDDRYQTMSAFRHELQEILTNKSPGLLVQKKEKKRSSVAVVVCLLTGLLLSSYWISCDTGIVAMTSLLLKTGTISSSNAEQLASFMEKRGRLSPAADILSNCIQQLSVDQRIQRALLKARIAKLQLQMQKYEPASKQATAAVSELFSLSGSPSVAETTAATEILEVLRLCVCAASTQRIPGVVSESLQIRLRKLLGRYRSSAKPYWTGMRIIDIATWQPYHWSNRRQQILQFLQQLLKETHREFELNACLAMPLRICPPSEKHRIAQLIHTAESTPKN